MSKAQLGVRLAACAVVILAACGGDGGRSVDMQVAAEVEPSPPSVGATTVRLDLADAGGAPIAGADVSVEANMSHAGMQPVFSDATEVAPGRYVASFEWTMAGDWFLLVTATASDGTRRQGKVDVRAVRPAPR